jgi:asparagine synthase (glutamine-hydrolysing)
MAHGREVRLPFLRHELVEFIFSLPAHFKIRNRISKWILRQSMQDYLPGAIAWRKDKTGFEPPQQQWMQNPALQERVRNAKRLLVERDILSSTILDHKIQPQAVHEAGNYDWRFLSAGVVF